MDITYIISVLVVILFSMTLHEAMHAFMGYYLGDQTAKLEGRLTLNPIKHIDPFLTILLPVTLAIIGAPIFGGAKPVPFNPNMVRYGEWGAALVALAGPLTNLLLAFIAFGISVVVGQPVDLLLTTDASLVELFLTLAVAVNLGFFIFNMLPLPPLDGSRVLYALAPDFVRRGMEALEQYGIVVIFAIVLFASPFIAAIMTSATDFFLEVFSIIFGV
ncbi:MAG: site-2 protease family protein [Candidatus Microsaccharimonas sp.]